MMETTQTHENVRTTYIDLQSAAWPGMFINRLRVQPSAHRHHVGVRRLGWAWERHGKAAVLPWWNRRSTFPLQSKLTSSLTSVRTSGGIHPPPPCPPFYIICVIISFFVIAVLFHVFFRAPATAPEQTASRVSLCYEPWCTNHYVYDP